MARGLEQEQLASSSREMRGGGLENVVRGEKYGSLRIRAQIGGGREKYDTDSEIPSSDEEANP
ncbi:hypothetical protein CVT26_015206 [Gymnopilus dilepis]|uniref:Uncharacterized protein n=1 Tax=Gymnopilus dilepis TaxID=231916 RepID=A0A409X8Y3_9AGAR|nr:hypothetical protein CVT26_015206 [Gymnopilus dilepis]